MGEISSTTPASSASSAVQTIQLATLHTPVGWIEVGVQGEAVTSCRFVDSKPSLSNPCRQRTMSAALDALARYFSGEITALDAVRLDFSGTPFRSKVWELLRKIPAGQPLSYGAVASRVGAPRASRAVGTACGANPICLFVPCHRVIASDGSLGGFGGGLWRKEKLLELERRKAEY